MDYVVYVKRTVEEAYQIKNVGDVDTALSAFEDYESGLDFDKLVEPVKDSQRIVETDPHVTFYDEFGMSEDREMW